MRTYHPLRIAIVASAALAGVCLFAAGLQAEEYGPFKEQKTKLGTVLASPKGMTIYTYDKDQPGMSSCTGKCAGHWPPIKATASDKPTGDFTVIKRPDDTLQWAYKGKPVYAYDDDKKAGDVNGDGMMGAWHVVKAE
jgi:predicted lipoprotein with Yx(FWY)xxD motif